MFKAVVKTIVVLALLFIMLYVGMNNTHVIDFHFPVAGTTAKTPIHASAALVYFGVFAVGAIAATIAFAGSGSAGAAAKKSSSKAK